MAPADKQRHLCVTTWPCVDPLPTHPSADLEWKLTYVGSAESEKYDQVLDTVYVGPVAPGQYRFVFQVREALPAGGPAAQRQR